MSLLQDGIFQAIAGAPLIRRGGPSTYVTIRDEGRLQMRRPRSRAHHMLYGS